MTRRKSIKLDTPQAVRKALSRIANMVLNGEIDPKSANSIIIACNAILGCLNKSEITIERGTTMKTDKQYKIQSLLRMAEITGDEEKRKNYLAEVEKLLSLNEKIVNKILDELDHED